MPAPRYENWTHLRIVGDKDAGAALIPTARKVLGYVSEQARFNSLGTSKRVQKVEGGEIVAEIVGGQPRITITVERGGGGGQLEAEGGFILWPRWDVPVGDPSSPGQQVDPTGVQPNGWLEFRGGAKVTRYYDRWDVVDNIEGARFEKFSEPHLYPEGMRYYGNIDWKDGADLALSFYGYISRYQLDNTVADDTARFIFQQGQLLFDRNAYREETEAPVPDFLSWRVNSACLRRSADGFPEMVVAFTDYVTGHTTTAQSVFVAFRINRREGDLQKGNWVVQPGSHRVLGTTPGKINPDQPSTADTFSDAAHPWLFNSDGTSAIRTVTSEQDGFGRENTMIQTVSIADDAIEHDAVMSDYMVGDYANGLTSFQLLAPARGLCASDYAGSERKDLYINMRESYGTHVGPGGEPATLRVLTVLEFPGGELTLMDRSFAVGNDVLDYHLLAYTDLRHNLYAGWRIRGRNGAHTIQAFAYMGGRMEYGVEEDVDWDPASGTGAPFPGLDTRAVGTVVDGLVFGAYWTAAAGAGWGPKAGQSGIIWRRQPRMGLTYFSGTSAIMTAMLLRFGCLDFANFNWPGGWNFLKGRYCVSMPGGYGAALNYLTGGNMGELLGITAEDRRFWPLTILPKPI